MSKLGLFTRLPVDVTALFLMSKELHTGSEEMNVQRWELGSKK
jgi:hypothetical protein